MEDINYMGRILRNSFHKYHIHEAVDCQDFIVDTHIMDDSRDGFGNDFTQWLSGRNWNCSS